jgi:hypothetical protein
MAMQPRTLIVSLFALLFAGLALADGPAWAGDGRFRAGEDIGIELPQSVAVGDFNSDGRPDLAATRYLNGRVHVLLGAAGGGFTAATNVTVGRRPRQVVVADFDADGRDDLAIANTQERYVSVRLGQGDGTFTRAADVELTRYPLWLAVGDFNADNREDLAIATKDSSGTAVTMRVGVGDGTFTDLGEVSSRGGPLAVGDFNSDGREDLAFGSLASASAGVLIGTGSGTFTPGGSVDLPGRADGRKALAVGDFDSDGNQDVAAAVAERDVVSVRLGKGDGTFGGGPNVPVGDYPYAVAVGDFDSDGNEDLAVAMFGANSASVRLGDGAGGFKSAADVPTDGGATDLSLADFDSDGNEDMVIAAHLGDIVSVRYGLGAPPLTGNLLTNGGFEGPGAARKPTDSEPIPGWQRTGGMTYARYGIPSHAYFPSRLAAPRYLTGQQSLLWGGNSSASGGITEATQTVDVSGSAASIDAGTAEANLSAYLGGALGYGDRMAARAEFLAATGGTLGSVQVGPVTAAERKQLTTLVRRAGSAPVPVGTRRIRVTLGSTDDDKGYSSAVADNVKLTLTAADPAPTPGPGPAPTPTPTPPPDPSAPPPEPQAFGPGTRIALKLAARRIPSKGPVEVRVTNRNAFAVTGTLRARTARAIGARRKRVSLKAARLRLAAGGRTTVRLRLTRPLRRQLKRTGKLALRLAAFVGDPAGNSRTVRKRATVRLKRGRARR